MWMQVIGRPNELRRDKVTYGPEGVSGSEVDYRFGILWGMLRAVSEGLSGTVWVMLSGCACTVVRSR